MYDDIPDDTSNIVPVLVHMDRADWKAFKEIIGARQGSRVLRVIVKRELAAITANK